MKNMTNSVTLLCVAAGLGLATSAHALTGFDLQDAANYAVLYEGNGGHQLQINNGPGLNGLAINGNIGIGGTGALQLSGPLVINGNTDFASATPNDNGPYSGNIHYNGVISGGHANVQSDLNYLNNLSATLGGYSGTSLAINTHATGNQTINVSAGNVVNGSSIFSVSSMNFQNGETLTINGDGTHKVVFNINFNSHFSGNIVLTGGLTSDDVMFNLIGGASLTGGDTLQTAANGGTLYGTFLDPNGTINLNNVYINGRVFGGDSSDMQIVSGAEINQPSTVPDAGSSLLLMTLGLGLLFGAKRHFLG